MEAVITIAAASEGRPGVGSIRFSNRSALTPIRRREATTTGGGQR
jgi:hypothetical protein